jgi:hypothetical protein
MIRNIWYVYDISIGRSWTGYCHTLNLSLGGNIPDGIPTQEFLGGRNKISVTYRIEVVPLSKRNKRDWAEEAKAKIELMLWIIRCCP